jgi:hypothetical protein
MEQKYINTDAPNFVKEARSGAILNTDNDKLMAYKKQKLAFESSRNNSERINKLENDLSEIKSLLKQILEKK